MQLTNSRHPHIAALFTAKAGTTRWRRWRSLWNRHAPSGIDLSPRTLTHFNVPGSRLSGSAVLEELTGSLPDIPSAHDTRAQQSDER
jgi:hypothetical protein